MYEKSPSPEIAITQEITKKVKQYYGNEEKVQKCPQNRYRNLFVNEKRKRSELKKFIKISPKLKKKN